MKKLVLLTAAALVAGAVTTSPAAQADPGSGINYAPTGVQLPEGARLVGVVTAPMSDLVNGVDAVTRTNVMTNAVRKPRPRPAACEASNAWIESGVTLRGYLYVVTDPQSGYSEAFVSWETDDGDWVAESGEGARMFASPDCAKTLLLKWSITDVSSTDTCIEQTVQGPYGNDPFPTEYTAASTPTRDIFGAGYFYYFIGAYNDTGNPADTHSPCLRPNSTVIFKAELSYIEKNRNTEVPVGCVQRSWPVTFMPNPGEDPTNPRLSWLKVGAASPETYCVSAW